MGVLPRLRTQDEERRSSRQIASIILTEPTNAVTGASLTREDSWHTGLNDGDNRRAYYTMVSLFDGEGAVDVERGQASYEGRKV